MNRIGMDINNCLGEMGIFIYFKPFKRTMQEVPFPAVLFIVYHRVYGEEVSPFLLDQFIECAGAGKKPFFSILEPGSISLQGRCYLIGFPNANEEVKMIG